MKKLKNIFCIINLFFVQNLNFQVGSVSSSLTLGGGQIAATNPLNKRKQVDKSFENQRLNLNESISKFSQSDLEVYNQLINAKNNLDENLKMLSSQGLTGQDKTYAYAQVDKYSKELQGLVSSRKKGGGFMSGLKFPTSSAKNQNITESGLDPVLDAYAKTLLLDKNEKIWKSLSDTEKQNINVILKDLDVRVQFAGSGKTLITALPAYKYDENLKTLSKFIGMDYNNENKDALNNFSIKDTFNIVDQVANSEKYFSSKNELLKTIDDDFSTAEKELKNNFAWRPEENKSSEENSKKSILDRLNIKNPFKKKPQEQLRFVSEDSTSDDVNFRLGSMLRSKSQESLTDSSFADQQERMSILSSQGSNSSSGFGHSESWTSDQGSSDYKSGTSHGAISPTNSSQSIVSTSRPQVAASIPRSQVGGVSESLTKSPEPEHSDDENFKWSPYFARMNMDVEIPLDRGNNSRPGTTFSRPRSGTR